MAIAAIKTAITEFYGDNPLQSPYFASLVDNGHFRRVSSMLKDGEVVFGGQYQEEARRIAPTLIRNPQPGSSIMTEEIFGPILPILTFRSREELMDGLRLNVNPLATYIFSEKREFRKWLLNHWNFGGGCINHTLLHLLHPDLPFGGIGKSGQGQYHGEASFKTFSHERSVLHGSLFPDIRIWFPPYQTWKLKLSRWFLK
jgi:aldehyde dehydrogenase (NAD+)